jgi:hypothetical protein
MPGVTLDTSPDRQTPEGILFPDQATIYLAAIEDQDYKEEKINCGCGMSCLG